MIDKLMELFTLWEMIDKLDEVQVRRSDLFARWEQLCWSMQIELILAGDEKKSYLNALAALSDRIYVRYRKPRKRDYLRVLLEKLGTLIEERDKPDRYSRSILKITISDHVNKLIGEMAKFNIQEGLSNILKSVLKDISSNIEPSTHLVDYLKSFSNWLKQRKELTSDCLIDQLISTNFNHPAFLEYMLNLYESAQNDNDDVERLKHFQLTLIKKQLHLDLLKLRSSMVMFKENEAVADILKEFLATEIKWVGLRLNKRWRENAVLDTSNSQVKGFANEPFANKILAKWPSDKSDLVELVYALYVYMRTRGSQVTIAALVKWCEDAFGVSLARYSHRFAEIKMRKSTRPSKFLDIMVSEFLNYVEDGNAFLPITNS
ncbi:RteC domain-containing protein [Mucilaginibacter paludis]|uniref:Uncharacterized protein n=1 Tax=Mucilaginibacter paludis DSM 18603 TaxID=714943 RepID=H1Y411_9SPHI|nr:RteC domain-containing protein [Mucilaginibacter paludis]EHQ30956.1 hypothetical protein Mucpa_6907 [Mucilaginibacter paludis DSM 18603]